ncbi:MAG: hypothetical protein PHE96_02130, partial [Methylococcales bacterium]|nr:hypothetical protein [Methylococcales bacterium]
GLMVRPHQAAHPIATNANPLLVQVPAKPATAITAVRGFKQAFQVYRRRTYRWRTPPTLLGGIITRTTDGQGLAALLNRDGLLLQLPN